MWFFVHGVFKRAFGETTGKPVGLVPFVVFVVAVFRRFLFFLPLLFRCNIRTPSAAAVRPAAKDAAVINLFGFPYGINHPSSIASIPSSYSPRSAFLSSWFFLFSPRVACGWFLVYHLLLVAACSKKQQLHQPQGRSWPSFFFLSLPCSLPFFGRFLVSILGESAATGRCYRGSRREQDSVFKNTSCLPLLLSYTPGGRLRVRGQARLTRRRFLLTFFSSSSF